MPFPYNFPISFPTEIGAAATAAGISTVTCNLRNLIWMEQQKTANYVLLKVVLTKAGEDTYTYYNYDRVLYLEYTEQPNSYIANITLNNSDNVLTSIDLTGYTASVSWGMKTEEGDLYRTCAPLDMLYQSFNSNPGSLTCSLTCIGVLDKVNLEAAYSDYLPAADAADTLKDVIIGLLAGVAYGYNVYDAVAIVWDSEDSVIDSFVIKNYFKVREGASRLSKVNEVIGYTTMVKRVESDGKIHFFDPTVSGADYDYEYELSGDHTFFAKTTSSSIIVPNYIFVKYPGILGGVASDATSWGLLPSVVTYTIPITSQDEGDDIALSMLQRVTLDAQRGYARVPMNVFQRIWDYILITDSREGGSTKAGNVQYIKRTWDSGTGEAQMEIRFGNSTVGLPDARTGANIGETPEKYVTYSSFQYKLREIGQILEGLADDAQDDDKRLDAAEERLDTLEAFH